MARYRAGEPVADGRGQPGLDPARDRRPHEQGHRGGVHGWSPSARPSTRRNQGRAHRGQRARRPGQGARPPAATPPGHGPAAGRAAGVVQAEQRGAARSEQGRRSTSPKKNSCQRLAQVDAQAQQGRRWCADPAGGPGSGAGGNTGSTANGRSAAAPGRPAARARKTPPGPGCA